MPSKVYSEINLPITWHTKQRAAVIVGGIERQLFQLIGRRMAETAGVHLRAIGGTADHIHIAVSMPPTVNISEWVGQIKGASAHFVNRVANRKVLEWQIGYGVVSFGTKDLPWVAEYKVVACPRLSLPCPRLSPRLSPRKQPPHTRSPSGA